MKGKIIFIFSIIMIIALGLMLYMKKNIHNDYIPIIFMGVFTVLLVVFILFLFNMK